LNGSDVPAWTSVEAHQACISAPAFKEVAPKLVSIIDDTRGQPTVLHGHFAEDFKNEIRPILVAPVTEIALITAKSAEQLEETKTKTTELIETAVRPSLGCHGYVLGNFVEDPNKLLVLVGWDTVEVRKSRWVLASLSNDFIPSE